MGFAVALVAGCVFLVAAAGAPARQSQSAQDLSIFLCPAYVTGVAGLTVAVGGGVTGTDNPISFDWGDSTTSEGSFPAFHTYLFGGTYEITASVSESEDTATADESVDVGFGQSNPAPYSFDPSPIAPAASLSPGQKVVVSLTLRGTGRQHPARMRREHGRRVRLAQLLVVPRCERLGHGRLRRRPDEGAAEFDAASRRGRRKRRRSDRVRGRIRSARSRHDHGDESRVEPVGDPERPLRLPGPHRPATDLAPSSPSAAPSTSGLATPAASTRLAAAATPTRLAAATTAATSAAAAAIHLPGTPTLHPFRARTTRRSSCREGSASSSSASLGTCRRARSSTSAGTLRSGWPIRPGTRWSSTGRPTAFRAS